MRPGRTQVETEADMNESQTSAHSALARYPKKSTTENISAQHGKTDSQIQPQIIRKISIAYRLKETILFIVTPTKITIDPILHLIGTKNYSRLTTKLEIQNKILKVSSTLIHSRVIYIGSSKRLNDYYVHMV
jgi:hypothetical protein